jgi:transposase
MKAAGLKKKKVKVQNVPARLDDRLDEFANSSLILDNKINEILKEEGHLVFLDECLFKSRDFTRRAWSNPKQNLQVFDRTYNQPVQAVSMAICKCHGVLTQLQVDYALTVETFKEMLDSVSGAVDDEKVFLFMDNARFHKSEEVAKHMKKLNIEPVFNVAYRFEFNPIERLFAMYKQHFRKVLLRKMLDYPEAKATPLK